MQAPKPRASGNNRGLAQAYEFRDLAAEEAQKLRALPSAANMVESQARARALRDLCTVWRDASERIRILRNRPLPGSLRPEKKPAKRKATTAPVFTEEPPEPKESLLS